MNLEQQMENCLHEISESTSLIGACIKFAITEINHGSFDTDHIKRVNRAIEVSTGHIGHFQKLCNEARVQGCVHVLDGHVVILLGAVKEYAEVRDILLEKMASNAVCV